MLAGVLSREGWVGRAGGGLSVGPATVRPAAWLDTAQQGCPSLLNCAPQGSRLLLQPLVSRLTCDPQPPPSAPLKEVWPRDRGASPDVSQV